jgi:hypothetical protein
MYTAGNPERYRVAIAWQEPGEPLPLTFESELLLEVLR